MLLFNRKLITASRNTVHMIAAENVGEHSYDFNSSRTSLI
jgi:hypothetical protein